MKKSLLIAGIAAAVMMSSSMTYAAATAATDTKTQTPCEKKMSPKDFKDAQKHKKMDRPDRPNLDDRLKLTEDQKQKAHDLRMQGHKKMKPVFEKMRAKKDEIKKIEASNLSQDKKDKKIEAIKNDIKNLKIEARKIRMENTKQFEAILTPEQKAEFEKVKQEGRERAKQHHMKKQPCTLEGKKVPSQK